jgi:hypothetical protein
MKSANRNTNIFIFVIVAATCIASIAYHGPKLATLITWSWHKQANAEAPGNCNGLVKADGACVDQAIISKGNNEITFEKPPTLTPTYFITMGPGVKCEKTANDWVKCEVIPAPVKPVQRQAAKREQELRVQVYTVCQIWPEMDGCPGRAEKPQPKETVDQ